MQRCEFTWDALATAVLVESKKIGIMDEDHPGQKAGQLRRRPSVRIGTTNIEIALQDQDQGRLHTTADPSRRLFIYSSRTNSSIVLVLKLVALIYPRNCYRIILANSMKFY